MLTIFLSLLIVTQPDTTRSSVSIPVSVIDSIIWEVARGRTCGKLVKAQETEINAFSALLVTQGKRIDLALQENEALAYANGERFKQIQAVVEMCEIKIERFRERIKDLWKWLLVAVGGDVVLAAVLLALLL